jgi:hypothetical protein
MRAVPAHRTEQIGMRLTKNKTNYVLPRFSAIQSVRLRGNQRYNQMHDILLPVVPIERMLAYAPSPMPSRPTHVAIHHVNGHDEIMFWPPPDEAYRVTVSYYPPLKEF